MQIVCQVQSESQPEIEYKRRGRVKHQRLSLQDKDPSGLRLIQTFDYDLSDEEKVKYAGKLLDKVITLAVTDMSFFGARARFSGKILDVKS